jgi:phosphoglycerate dehydrogenase-like enzyme
MVTRPVVVVLGATANEPPPGIETAGTSVDIRYAADGEALRDAIGEAEGLYFWRAKREWLEGAFPAAGRLRWIQTASDGVDGLLFPALVDSDVVVTNARGVFDGPIAEWVIAAILAFTTGLQTSIVDQIRAGWTDGRRRERVAGQHLLVVGPGPIGRATASRARLLGLTVEAVGRSAREDDVLGTVHGPEALHGALGRADHVLDALPLAAGTRQLFDAAAFAAMRPTALFYNVGRGGTVDESALIEALRSGAIGGAGLDVFADEPLLPGSPLWSMPNVIVSPHVSGDLPDWEDLVVDVFVDNTRRFAAGEQLRNRVDVNVGFGVG